MTYNSQPQFKKPPPPTPPPRGSTLSQSAGSNSPIFSSSNSASSTPPHSPSLSYNQLPQQSQPAGQYYPYPPPQQQSQPAGQYNQYPPSTQPGQYPQTQPGQYYPYPPPPSQQSQTAGQYGQPLQQHQQYYPQQQQPQQQYYPLQQQQQQYYPPPQNQYNPYGQPSQNVNPSISSLNQQSPILTKSPTTPPPSLTKMDQPPQLSQMTMMTLPPPPHQPQQYALNQPIFQNVQNIGNSATFNLNAPDPIIDDNFRLIPPAGTFFVQGHKLQVRIISAQNLVAADINGFSDPYVKIKSDCINIKATKAIQKNLNPTWNETVMLEIENPIKDCLILEVYDEDLVGEDDFLGYVSVDLSLLPIGIPVTITQKLFYAKHGTIEFELLALDFGVSNIPMSYVPTFIKWRSDIKGLTRKDFKEIKKLAKTAKKDSGPYFGKITYAADYKFYYGHIKRRRTKGEVAGDVGKITLKIVGYTLLLPIALIASG